MTDAKVMITIILMLITMRYPLKNQNQNEFNNNVAILLMCYNEHANNVGLDCDMLPDANNNNNNMHGIKGNITSPNDNDQVNKMERSKYKLIMIKKLVGLKNHNI